MGLCHTIKNPVQLFDGAEPHHAYVPKVFRIPSFLWRNWHSYCTKYNDSGLSGIGEGTNKDTLSPSIFCGIG